jgi:hypothetical protein
VLLWGQMKWSGQYRHKTWRFESVCRLFFYFFLSHSLFFSAFISGEINWSGQYIDKTWRSLELFVLPFSTQTNKTNCVALVRKRTIPTERPPLVGEISANFSG